MWMLKTRLKKDFISFQKSNLLNFKIHVFTKFNSPESKQHSFNILRKILKNVLYDNVLYKLYSLKLIRFWSQVFLVPRQKKCARLTVGCFYFFYKSSSKNMYYNLKNVIKLIIYIRSKGEVSYSGCRSFQSISGSEWTRPFSSYEKKCNFKISLRFLNLNFFQKREHSLFSFNIFKKNILC